MNMGKICGLLLAGFGFAVHLSAVPADTQEELTSYRDQALAWLEAQIPPNSMLDKAVPQRRNLIISYRVDENDPAYPYVRGRSYTYDDALTAIAFTMCERYREAEDLLFSLSRQLRRDGSLWFGFNLHNNWPSEEDHSEATVRSGASAWAGYAAVFYLQKRRSTDGEVDLSDRINKRILYLAEKVAGHLQSLQIIDRNDPRFGLVTGGMGAHILKDNGGTVETSYSDAPLEWVSAEHNIDAWFLFSGLADLTGEERWRTAASLTYQGLLNMWDSEKSQIIQGIKKEGKRDTVLPLDTASWGSMFLRAAGETEKADTTLNTGVERFSNKQPGQYRPYADDPVYENPAVTAAIFGKNGLTWREMDINWPEGALGMAAALVKAGDFRSPLEIIRTAASIAVDGGIPYSTLEVPHQFSTWPSVASTAWLVIAIELILDSEDNRLFWSAR